MEILEITQAMASAVSHIYANSWKSAYKGIVPQKYLDELSLEQWTPFLKDSLYTGFVLKEGNELVATSSISPARDEAMKGWGEIISIYVLPQYFHKGYGKKLFSFVTAQLHSNGFQNIYLWVLESNQRARAFYERNGFYFNGDILPITIGGKELIEMRYINQAK